MYPTQSNQFWTFHYQNKCFVIAVTADELLQYDDTQLYQNSLFCEGCLQDFWVFVVFFAPLAKREFVRSGTNAGRVDLPLNWNSSPFQGYE